MAYKKFSEQEIKRAAETDIVDMLRRQGEELKAVGSEYEWKHGADRITIRGGQWYNHYEERGGNAIKFVQEFFGKNFKEAMEYLLGGTAGELKTSKPKPVDKPKQKTDFQPPNRNESMRRVYAYLLTKRGLDKDVVSAFVKQGLIYESADYHNAVFVGEDKNGKIMHASLRATGDKSSFRGNAENSVPEYSFHWYGKSDRLYIFEAPIDMLSYISMNKEGWEQHSYAACCGVGDRVLWQMLKDKPDIKKVYVCLDNDEKGRMFDEKISDKLFEKGIASKILIPKHKDWNDDLRALQAEQAEQADQAEESGEDEEADLCQGLQL